MNEWKKVLREQMPLLGHRNWIVVTDKAYPLQTNPGVATLYLPGSFAEVAAEVAGMIKESNHVFAHVYQDSEQQVLNEKLCPGIEAYRKEMRAALGDAADEVAYLPHEDLILRLDTVSKLYRVMIVKTELTLPYTSVFFELDCKYWDAEREREMRDALARQSVR